MARARTLRRILGWAALLPVLGAAALGIWLGTSSDALQWAVARLEAAAGGRLRIEQAQGSLLGPITVRRVSYLDPDLSAAIDDLHVVVAWPRVLQGTIAFGSLAARSVEVRTTPSSDDAPRAPQSLALPLPVAIGQMEIERLVWRSGDASVTVAPLQGAYAGGPRAHRVVVQKARTPWGDVGAEIRVGAAPPFAISGTLRFAGSHRGAPATVDAKLDGSLQALAVEARLTAAGAQGDAAAQLALFAPDWLVRGETRWRGVDAAALAPGAPRTDLQVELRLAGGGKDGFQGTAAARNAAAGPLSANRLPLVSLQTGVVIRGADVTFAALRADLGAAGRAQGDGGFAQGAAHVDLKVEALDLHAVHSSVRATRLAGALHAEGTADTQRVTLALRDERVAVSAELALADDTLSVKQFLATVAGGELRGDGRVALSGERGFAARVQARGFDPSAFGDWPRALLNGRAEAEGVLAPEWRAAIRATLADSRYGDAPLETLATFNLAPQRVSGLAAQFRLGANQAKLRGDFGRAADALQVEFDARNLSQIDARLAGRLAGKAQVLGTPQQFGGSASVEGSALAFEQRWSVRQLRARGSLSADAERRLSAEAELTQAKLPPGDLQQLRLSAAGRAASHELVVEAKGGPIDARVAASGAWLDEGGWRGTLQELVNRGALPVSLASAAPLELRAGRVAFGPAVLKALQGDAALDFIRLEEGRLESAGRLRALSVVSLLAAAGREAPAGSDLRLRGEWSIAATPRLNGSVRIEREGGDLVLSQEPRLVAEIQTLALAASLREDVVDLEGALRTQRKGSFGWKARVVPAPGAAPGVLGADARVEGTLDANVPTLSVIQALIGGAAAIDGRLDAALQVGGTLGAPRITGTARAEGVRLDMPQHALALRDGAARVTLDGRVLRVEKLSIRGGDGELRASGEVPLGEGTATLDWQAERLRLFNRPDRQLVLSGSGGAALTGERLVMRGALTADLGVFELATQETEHLGDDVVVLGRRAETAKPARRAPPLALVLSLDAGERFRVRASGLDAGLRGRLRLRTREDGELTAAGNIETRGGTYRAFGQSLAIERGRLHFDGPVANPGLDVLALRKNQEVEAGVQVSGTVRSPVVRLVSNPPVPDHEKLAWLMLGRGAASASGAEGALLQATLGALSDREGSLTGRLERGLGVDEIGLRGGAAGPALAIGKRLSDRIVLEYEQGLASAAALVRLRYVLSRTVNLSAEASSTGSSIGIGYGKSYD